LLPQVSRCGLVSVCQLVQQLLIGWPAGAGLLRLLPQPLAQGFQRNSVGQ
jgi:hypothetical protein